MFVKGVFLLFVCCCLSVCFCEVGETLQKVEKSISVIEQAANKNSWTSVLACALADKINNPWFLCASLPIAVASQNN